MMKTVTGELWGGPFDGEMAECPPAPAAVSVFEEIGSSEYVRVVGPHPEPEKVARLLGSYHWTDPRRLTWVPL